MGIEKMKIGNKKNKKTKQNNMDVEMSEKSKGIKKDIPRRKRRIHEKKK
jgi:hypothetical protein